MYGTITAEGHTIVPQEIREKMGLKAGDRVYWTYVDGHAVVRRKTGSLMDIAGMLYDPNRKPLTIEELEEAIGTSVAEGVMESMKTDR